MTLTLLLDLDDTLLDSNMDTFIPAYFEALSGALEGWVSPDVMLPALMGGTRRMMANEDPRSTLREVFDAYFFPKLGIERESLQAAIDQFYDEVFPSLQKLTTPRPDAVALVEWAFGQGFRVAISTNPLFPLKAIHHRMRWAGLAPDRYPFSLVTSYEGFHFTKTTPAYYAECLSQLGWPDGPVVMIGDDDGMDITPARAAGLPVFWVRKSSSDVDRSVELPQGTIADVRSWLEKVDHETLRPTLQEPPAILAALRATPAALAALTRYLPDEKWHCYLKPGEWCLVEIMCHLRDVEQDINHTRLQAILKEENPFIAGVVSDDWVEERQYARQDGKTALEEFTRARLQTLDFLSRLGAEWARPARHAIFGPTTLRELVKFIVEHDQAHIRQTLETSF
jgi:FMN phosphatase YigB (HAD superfamily)